MKQTVKRHAEHHVELHQPGLEEIKIEDID